MATIPFKPRDSPTRRAVKELKRDSVKTTHNEQEATLQRGAYLSSEPMYVLLSGEILHQLALKCERRGQTVNARALYIDSLKRFKKSEPLGHARVLRDYGLFLCRHGEVDEGLELAKQALDLHKDDVQNAKGKRQRRITEGYVWRAQVLAGQDVKSALAQLTEFAMNGCLDCSLRDQDVLVTFALKYARGTNRPPLIARQIDIQAELGRPVDVVTSIVRLIIDIELIVAGKVLRTIFRRE